MLQTWQEFHIENADKSHVSKTRNTTTISNMEWIAAEDDERKAEAAIGIGIGNGPPAGVPDQSNWWNQSGTNRKPIKNTPTH